MTDRRPAINQIGKVTDDGEIIKVSGWGISWCAARCTCHLIVAAGFHLRLHEGDDGSLGLATSRPGCDCCQPWTVEELTAITAELAEIQAAPEVSR